MPGNPLPPFETAGEPLIGVVNAGSSSLKFDLYEGDRWLRRHQARISAGHSRVGAYVIKADENLMIARHARAVLASR